MKTEKQLRKEILNLTKEFYRARKQQEPFIPGETQISYGGRVYNEKEMMNLVDAALDFWLSMGRFAEQFEKEFASFLGVKYCLLTNSGSSANLLAVSALTSPKLGERRLKPGDEVITTACGFPTTLNPIVQNNLVPVFLDVELDTYNIKVGDIEKALSPKTKAIFVAHGLGNPANLRELGRIAKKYNLWLIEDNCDAVGSKYQGKYTGTFGDIATCSFYASHHMTMGEGGAVLTSNGTLKKIIASFRDWGREFDEPGMQTDRFSSKVGELPFGYDRRYIFSHIGYNLKITDLQPAIGLAQLEKLPSFIEARKKNFAALKKALEPYSGFLAFPRQEKEADPCWFGFPMLVKQTAPFTRKEMVEFLEERKVMTRMFLGGNLLKQPAYKDIQYRVFDSLSNTDSIMEHLLWIGVYPGITKEKMRYMTGVLLGIFGAV
ncbi:MAG: DegT/DnrJ/EryC1/StrS aminotransferase [Parcubacteria group bacterium GW2011_GWA2_50_10]|nr:MAG: DegT/DnrJ/EryC1/StrS aminotransferase [Parcubacteria group bacterium GW2011_GWA2_50_10]